MPSVRNPTSSQDRFISSKTLLDFTSSPSHLYSPYLDAIQSTILKSKLKCKILNFSPQRPFKKTQPLSCIPRQPVKILDAPFILKDPCVSLMDWQPNESLTVLLQNNAYLYSSEQTTLLASNPNDGFTSVSSLQGLMALGDAAGKVVLTDLERRTPLRKINGHFKRVNCITFNSNNLLFSAGKDRAIHGHDCRIPRSLVYQFQGHQAEVSALKSTQKQVASGAADGKLIIWDLLKNQCNAVKKIGGLVGGIAYSAWNHSLLATSSTQSGVKIWNPQTAELQKQIKPEGQAINVIWLNRNDDLACSVGSPHNCIQIWKTTRPRKLVVLEGHLGRISHLALNRQGNQLSSGSEDESVRIWQLGRESQHLTLEEEWW